MMYTCHLRARAQVNALTAQCTGPVVDSTVTDPTVTDPGSPAVLIGFVVFQELLQQQNYFRFTKTLFNGTIVHLKREWYRCHPAGGSRMARF